MLNLTWNLWCVHANTAYSCFIGATASLLIKLTAKLAALSRHDLTKNYVLVHLLDCRVKVSEINSASRDPKWCHCCCLVFTLSIALLGYRTKFIPLSSSRPKGKGVG